MLRTLGLALFGLALTGSAACALVSEKTAGPTSRLFVDEVADAAAVRSPLVQRSLEAMPVQRPVADFGEFGHTGPGETAPVDPREIDGAFGCGDEESGVSGILTPKLTDQ